MFLLRQAVKLLFMTDLDTLFSTMVVSRVKPDFAPRRAFCRPRKMAAAGDGRGSVATLASLISSNVRFPNNLQLP